MASFRDVDLEMQRYLDSEGAGPSRMPDNCILRHEIGQRVQKKLRTVATEDPDKAYASLFGYAPSRDTTLPPTNAVPFRFPTASQQPTKKSLAFGGRNQRMEHAAELHKEAEVLGGWWQTMADPALQVSGLPTLPQPAESSGRAPAPTSKKKRYALLAWTDRGMATDCGPRPKHRRPKGVVIPEPQVPGLRGLVQRNITTLRKMRKTHSKLNALHAGEEPRPLSPPPPEVDWQTRSAAYRGPIPLEGGHPVARGRIDAIGGMLLEHAGFEGESASSSKWNRR